MKRKPINVSKNDQSTIHCHIFAIKDSEIVIGILNHNTHDKNGNFTLKVPGPTCIFKI